MPSSPPSPPSPQRRRAHPVSTAPPLDLSLEPATPGDSVAGLALPVAPGSELRRRLTRLMAVRTAVISLVLGLTIWVGNVTGVPRDAPAYLALIGAVIATYALTIVYAILLRRGFDPARLVWPQLAGDLLVTSVLVYVTGGAQSAYTFFFALSVVGAAAVRYRRGALVIAAASVVLVIAIGLLAWADVLPLPMLPQLHPGAQRAIELARSLGLSVAILGAIGLLAYVLGAELERSAATLASQQQATGELYALHRDIVRSLSSGLVTVDLDGKLLTINQTASDLLAVAPDRAVGLPIDLLMPGMAARLGALSRRGKLRRSDLVLPPRDGRPARTLGISISPLRDVGDHVIGRVINFSDLTELRTLEETMRRAERLATVGQLAAGIAHEIRNPLASISGSIELLGQAPRASEEDKALMTIVLREIDRLNALVGELLDYANPRPPELVEFDLAELLAETLQVVRQDRSWGGVKVVAELPPAPLEVVADPAKLRQVAWNLVRNATEALAGGVGQVTVRARDEGDQVVVEVEDDGPGIPADQLGRIFDPFFTTKKRGTGLGLATCHGIVAEHGGTLTVESAPGRGSKFVMTLPRRTQVTGVAPPAVSSRP
ncbi:MAG TPA: ATP-binding protein [Kofleriaceae bacterium]|nr:ATP-binding protein [Kofleriaceae bacterium]